LVGLDWVAQVVFVNLFLVVPQEPANGLDARGGLQVLAVNCLVDDLFSLSCILLSLQPKEFEDSHQSALKALQIPVLVDDLVDDSSLKYLMCLVCKQENKIVHCLQLFAVLHVLGAPGWQELLTKAKDELSESLMACELKALLRVVEAHFDSVEDWSAHGQDERLRRPSVVRIHTWFKCKFEIIKHTVGYKYNYFLINHNSL
jgi:hypothetical protein